LRRGLIARANLERAHAFGQSPGKHGRNTALHEEAIGRRTRFAAIAHLGDHGPFNRGIQISIVEHNKRRIAAQFHRAGNDGIGRFMQ
jgi:hypothetical protein